METPAQDAPLAEAFLRLHLDGLRRGAGLAQQVSQRLLALQRQLRQHILMHDPTQALQRNQQAWLLTTLLAAIAEAIDMAYQEIETTLETASLALALQHAEHLVTVLKETEKPLTFDPVRAAVTLAVALRTTPFPSATTGTQPSAIASSWWQRQGETLTQRAQDQMRAGVLAGESGTVLARRLTGTPSRQGKDGLMAQALRSAEAVTEVQAALALTQGLEAVVRDNVDRVTYLEHRSVLDRGTTKGCRERDGKRFDPGTHAPTGHTLPYLSGPAYHFGCRSYIELAVEGMEDRFTLGPRPFEAILQDATHTERRRLLGDTALRRWEAGQLQGPELVQALVSRPLALEG